MSSRVTPHDLEAEKAVLGAVLVNGDRLLDVSERLKPHDFFRAGHATLYAGMLRLNEDRKPIDYLTLRDALTPAQLEEVGGVAYIASLTDGVPRGSNVVAYADIVRDRSVRRRLQGVADQVIAEAGTPTVAAASALDRAEQAIFEIGQGQQPGALEPVSALLPDVYAMLEQIQESGQPLRGLSTGFPDVDRLTRGFQPGNLIVLAARPGMGKSALMINFAHAVATAIDQQVACFSMEMSKQELMTRLLCSVGRVDSHRLMRGYADQDDYGRLSTAMAEVGASNLWIDDTAAQTIMSIRGKSRRLKARKGLGLVLIDYLQLMLSERRYDSRVTEVGALSRGLKIVAKELAVPVVCLAQLSRAPEARSDHRPNLSDLRESGSIEQDADVVMFIYRDAVYDKTADPADAELIIAKQRNGPTGTIELRWSGEMTRFDSRSQRSESYS